LAKAGIYLENKEGGSNICCKYPENFTLLTNQKKMSFDKKEYSLLTEAHKVSKEKNPDWVGQYKTEKNMVRLGGVINPLTKVMGEHHIRMIDEILSAKLGFGSFELYERFDGDEKVRDGIKETFLQDPNKNPRLDYPKLNPDELEKMDWEINRFQAGIAKYEQSDDIIKELYAGKLQEKKLGVSLLKASYRAATATDELTKQRAMAEFKEISEKIYGRPKQDIFDDVLDKMKEEIGAHIKSLEEKLNKAGEAQDSKEIKKIEKKLAKSQEAAGRFNKSVENRRSPEEKKNFLPDETSYNQAVNYIEAKLKPIVSEVGLLKQVSKLPEEERKARKFSPEEVRMIFEEVLKALEIKGWKVEYTKKGTVSVNQKEKKIMLSHTKVKKTEQGEEEMTIYRDYPQVLNLVAHEILTHLVRREQGEKGQISLLGLGVGEYEGIEEGIATALGAAASKDYEEYKNLSGGQYYLAIGLAYGLDGGPKRDFKGVYRIMEDYYLARGKKVDHAYNNCVRIFRGTTCDQPGVTFNKELIYREGNIAAWELMKCPELHTYFAKGKFNPQTEQKLVAFLKKLEIQEVA
jgi:hypothetical protein